MLLAEERRHAARQQGTPRARPSARPSGTRATPSTHVLAHSLPRYDHKVFERSIAGLRLLNAAGFGQPGSPLKLDLVYNPGGAFLPPSQVSNLVSQSVSQLRGGKQVSQAVVRSPVSQSVSQSVVRYLALRRWHATHFRDAGSLPSFLTHPLTHSPTHPLTN
eukprot:scaffold5328_cov51-Phaeocystis_antarctica.AAC.1